MSETQNHTTQTTTETPKSNDWEAPFGELRNSLKTLTDSVSQVLQGINQPRRQERAPEPDEPDLDDAALELLPRGKFAEYIANKTIKHMDKEIVQPLRNRLQEVTTQTTHAQLGAAVEAARAKYSDFNDYQAEMISLAKTHNTLPPEDLYILAKSRNPKVKTAPKGEGEGERKTPRIKFGGLKPSTGGTGTGAANKKMAPAEASTAAWDATVHALGGEPDFED